MPECLPEDQRIFPREISKSEFRMHPPGPELCLQSSHPQSMSVFDWDRKNRGQILPESLLILSVNSLKAVPPGIQSINHSISTCNHTSAICNSVGGEAAISYPAAVSAGLSHTVDRNHVCGIAHSPFAALR